jgi:hypothetical protein
VELIDANDWLKSIEKKLQVVQCNNREKVLQASHQLFGPAAGWWDAYMEAHEEPESINWLEFRAAFPCISCSPGSYQGKGVLGSEIGDHVCERLRHQVHSTVSLCSTWSRR